LAVSERVKAATCERSKIQAEKIRVIRNGIEFTACQSSYHSKLAENLTAQLDIKPDSHVCGTVARLHRQKGIRYLIEAFALLQTEFPKLKLLIVGEGPERAELEKKSAELGISRNVFFAGEIHPPAECLKLMNVFILPSLYEGFPNVLLEAMAAQVPVVASNVGGVNELVSQHENGLLCPPGDSRSLADAVRWLILHPNEAKKMAALAHDRIQKEFSLEGMLKEYEDLYESLLKEVRE
jgi:glycosyltransferase involved in cell wall biosynthesis